MRKLTSNCLRPIPGSKRDTKKWKPKLKCFKIWTKNSKGKSKISMTTPSKLYNLYDSSSTKRSRLSSRKMKAWKPWWKRRECLVRFKWQRKKQTCKHREKDLMKKKCPSLNLTLREDTLTRWVWTRIKNTKHLHVTIIVRMLQKILSKLYNP